jgi:hypothetical protein
MKATPVVADVTCQKGIEVSKLKKAIPDVAFIIGVAEKFVQSDLFVLDCILTVEVEGELIRIDKCNCPGAEQSIGSVVNPAVFAVAVIVKVLLSALA